MTRPGRNPYPDWVILAVVLSPFFLGSVVVVWVYMSTPDFATELVAVVIFLFLALMLAAFAVQAILRSARG